MLTTFLAGDQVPDGDGRAEHPEHPAVAGAPRGPPLEGAEGPRGVPGEGEGVVPALLLRGRRGPARDHRQLQEPSAAAEALQEDVCRRRGTQARQPRGSVRNS